MLVESNACTLELEDLAYFDSLKKIHGQACRKPLQGKWLKYEFVKRVDFLVMSCVYGGYKVIG